MLPCHTWNNFSPLKPTEAEILLSLLVSVLKGQRACGFSLAHGFVFQFCSWSPEMPFLFLSLSILFWFTILHILLLCVWSGREMLCFKFNAENLTRGS